MSSALATEQKHGLEFQVGKVAKLAIVAWLVPSLSSLTATDVVLPITTFVDELGQETVDSGQTVGLSIGVARGDTIICGKGFGLANAELSVPATNNTVYRIGSITKMFTAAAIMLLVEEGKIDLDAPMTEYLPDYPEQGNAVTIRHLLQHTSGIKDFTRLPGYRKERPLDVSQKQVMERFQDHPLEFQPGEKHRYCNSGYFLLAMVVQQVSGSSFREFAEQRLFAKLDLKDTYCDAAARIIPGRASGYTRWAGTLRNAPFVCLNQTVGAGNLASTVTDLITWTRGLMSLRLLSGESTKLMTTRGKLRDGRTFNYGFGIRIATVDGRPVVRHGGGISGFRSELAYFPDSEITIAVLANTDGVNTAKLSDRIARFLLNEPDNGDN